MSLASIIGGFVRVPKAGLSAAQVQALIDAAAGQFPATATNDDAAAGKVGEYIEATLARESLETLSAELTAVVASLNLSAGDWDVEGMVNYIPDGLAQVIVSSGSSETLGFPSDSNLYSQIQFAGDALASGPYGHVIPARRFSLASDATIFLLAKASFGGIGSSVSAYGIIHARRVR
jgi:hypothetical protein